MLSGPFPEPLTSSAAVKRAGSPLQLCLFKRCISRCSALLAFFWGGNKAELSACSMRGSSSAHGAALAAHVRVAAAPHLPLISMCVYTGTNIHKFYCTFSNVPCLKDYILPGWCILLLITVLHTNAQDGRRKPAFLCFARVSASSRAEGAGVFKVPPAHGLRVQRRSERKKSTSLFENEAVKCIADRLRFKLQAKGADPRAARGALTRPAAGEVPMGCSPPQPRVRSRSDCARPGHLAVPRSRGAARERARAAVQL